MQVVCQKAQRQKNAEDDQKGIEARQRLVLRAVDQDGQEEAQKGLREHGEIHGVPQIPLRCDLTGEHLVTEDLQNKLQEQADGDPQHQGAQPAVCDTLPHGDRPEKRQQPQNSDEKLKVKSWAYRRTRRRPHRRNAAANRMIFCFDALESINPRSSFLTAPACFLIIYYHYREGKRLCPPQK